MSNRSKIEESERLHYNQYASHKTRRDVLPSSRIPRRYITNRSMAPILKKLGGNLGTILDVGCGIAATAVHLSPNFNRYIGVDISEGMIEIGKEFTKEIDNVELLVANSKHIPVEAQVADVVFINSALHHMTDRESVIQSLIKHAKPKAWFVALEPQRANPLIQIMRRVRMVIDKSYSRDQVFFSEKELVDLAKKSGLCNVRVEYQGYILPPMAEVVLSPQWFFFPLATGFVFIEQILEKVLVGPLAKTSWNISVYGQFP